MRVLEVIVGGSFALGASALVVAFLFHAKRHGVSLDDVFPLIAVAAIFAVGVWAARGFA